jgi:hypothetical protein
MKINLSHICFLTAKPLSIYTILTILWSRNLIMVLVLSSKSAPTPQDSAARYRQIPHEHYVCQLPSR